MASDVTLNMRVRDAGARAALIAGSQAGDLFADSLKNAGDVARGVLAAGFIQDIGRGAQQFLGSAASAASGLEQAMGGTRAVFGEAAGAVDDFGKRSAQSVGLSERQFREATTLIGGQLKRMTGDVGLAAESSIELVQVGADLAATYGGTTKEAVDAFAAALRGEADPAERFNLNLKVSAVNAKAVELGLASSTSEVSEGAKAQALLALVLEQSADAQGQFAREADTAAVAQQKARAGWENAQAVLGQALLPVLGQAAGFVSSLAGGFGELPGPVQTTTAAVAVLAAGLLVALPRIAAAKVALAEMGISARLSGTRLGGFAAGAGRAAGVIGALIIAAQVLGNVVGSDLNPQLDALTEGVARFGRSGEVSGEAARVLGEGFGDLGEALRVLGPEGLGPSVGNAIKGIAEAPWGKVQGSLQRSREQVDAFDGALATLVRGGRQAEAADAFDRLNALANENGVSTERLSELLPGYAAALEKAGSSTEQGAAASAGAANELAVLGEAFGFAGDKAGDAAGKMLDAWGAASSDFISVGGVFDRVLDRKNAAEKRSAGSSGKSAEEVAEAHEEAARRVEKAAQSVERAKVDEARAIEDAAERVQDAEERLADAQRAARDAQRALTDARREAADQLAGSAGRITDAKLSGEAATLRLIRAENQLVEVGKDRKSSDLERREAELGVAQARRGLEQARQQLADVRAEEAAAHHAGVEGSDLVQGALERQREAAEGVIAAQEGVADAQRDSARAMSDAAQRVADAQQSMADATRDAAKVIEDSAGGAGGAMRGLADDTTVTVDEYIGELGRMVREQEAWAQNLIDLSARVPPAMLDELARLGPEGSAEVALLNSMSSAELDKVIGLFERKGRSSGRGFAENLARAGPTLAGVARDQGQRVADQLAAEMLRSGSDVFEAAKRLGVFIDRGLGGNRTITVFVNQQAVRDFGPNARQIFAHGGITGAQGGGQRTGLALVGEQGPELVQMAPGSHVTPAPTTRAMLNGAAGGGPVDVRLTVDFRGADEDFGRFMRKRIRVDNLLQGTRA